MKNLQEAFQVFFQDDDYYPKNPHKGARGIIEFTILDKNKNIVRHWYEPNLVKINAKSMLSHRLPSSQIWDINAGGGAGAWVDSGIDPFEEFSARYIIFGASFNENGLPLDVNDPRFYTLDPVTGMYVPIKLTPGAEYDGGLINAIPISDPNRPLKKVEKISFQPTYQPAGSPLMQSDVRAINNIVQFQTTLRLGEYNGFGASETDFFTITEVALAGGRKIDNAGACELDPKDLFRQGANGNSDVAAGAAIPCAANGGDTVTIMSTNPLDVDVIKAGDQVKLVGESGTLGQVNPYYLVLSKLPGGRDIQLDRTPVDSNNVPITGSVGIYRDTLRLFSHRVLGSPLKKSANFEIICQWSIIFS